MIINLYNYKNDINKYRVETDIFEYPKFYRKHNVLLLNRILYEVWVKTAPSSKSA